MNRQGEVSQRFSSHHLPNGVMPSQEDEMHTYDIRLVAGDCLYANSDGLTEAETKEGEMFGQY